jgi:hypothetical protein
VSVLSEARRLRLHDVGGDPEFRSEQDENVIEGDDTRERAVPFTTMFLTIRVGPVLQHAHRGQVRNEV